MTFRESYVERSHKMFNLHVSKMGYRNEPRLVEMTLRCPRCHPYRYPQIPYQHRHPHHCFP